MNNVAPLREQIVAKLYSAVISDALDAAGIRVRQCAHSCARSMTHSCSLAASGLVSMPIHTT
jgi:hypothetical protein